MAAYPNKYAFAHTIQCIGSLGVARIVQTGNDFGAGLIWHSKHSVLSYTVSFSTMNKEPGADLDDGRRLTHVSRRTRLYQRYTRRLA